jgi:ABC-2 type transport system permease protein
MYYKLYTIYQERCVLTLSISNIYFISQNELNRIIRHPLVIIVGIIILLLAYTNGAGGTQVLEHLDDNGQDGFFQGYSQIEYEISFICSIMAAFLGVISIAEDKWNYSANILLTKPVYRRDIILGKFAGLSEFMLLFITLTMLFTTIMLILCFREPLSYIELAWRLIAYILVLASECSLVITLTMLIGNIFNNVIGAVSVVITYIYVEWFRDLAKYMGDFSFITPVMLYIHIFSNLFNTTIPFSQWLNNTILFIIFMILEIGLMLVINCYIFTQLDTR